MMSQATVSRPTMIAQIQPPAGPQVSVTGRPVLLYVALPAQDEQGPPSGGQGKGGGLFLTSAWAAVGVEGLEREGL